MMGFRISQHRQKAANIRIVPKTGISKAEIPERREINGRKTFLP
jgi:hypothetical protein